MDNFKLRYFAYSGLFGLACGAVIGLFLSIVTLCHNFIWDYIPGLINDPALYPLLICLIGGGLVGMFAQRFKAYPRSINETLSEFYSRDRVDYKQGQIWKNAAAGFLILLFGASVGPEAALIAIVAGLLTFAADRIGFVSEYREELLEFGVGTTLGIIFMAPLFGIGRTLEADDWRNLTESRLKRYVIYIFTTFAGFLGYLLMNQLLPGQEQVFAIRSMDNGITWQGLLLIAPMIVLGALFGQFFIFAQEKAEKFNRRIKNPLPLAILAGFIFGLVGVFAPNLLFSGEHTLLSFTRQAENLSFVMLLIMALGKVTLTMMSLAFNWRGGTIFPMIFASVAFGLALTNLLPYSEGLLVAIFTAASCAIILRQPFAVACLFLLLFPVELFLWIWLAGYAATVFMRHLPFGKKAPVSRRIADSQTNGNRRRSRR
ncbi:chloride channel protein [Enterococcus sp. ALS3]|uniref:Chloride channel protein n=1 Tax=Enterococcus alishanensis TaxID=1303817 RepID=A0ABS6TBX9_9ENTE|nr:chloride channel protein [Enterococcus alishanensis]MBV7390410.1 chloride channel protein [Enterococcus alishanensis]